MNFLPMENQITFRKNYNKRVVIFFELFVLFIILAGALLLLPSYFFLEFKKEDIEKESALVNSNPLFEKTEIINKEIGALNSKIEILKRKKSGMALAGDLSEIFKEVIYNGEESVKINSLNFENKNQENSGSAISVSGESATRKNFLDFIKRLEKNQNVMKIDSPISNILKEAELKFNFTIFLKSKQ